MVKGFQTPLTNLVKLKHQVAYLLATIQAMLEAHLLLLDQMVV